MDEECEESYYDSYYDDNVEESEEPLQDFDAPLPKFNNGVNDKYSRPSLAKMKATYAELVKEYNKTNGGQIKSDQIIKGDQLREEAKRLIREQNPTCKPIEKLAQLEMHERLHCQYESGTLRKCMLSFYLHVMATKRRKLLHDMRSNKMAKD